MPLSFAQAFGASHTSFYTDAVKQDSYPMLGEILEAKLANKELVKVVQTMFVRATRQTWRAPTRHQHVLPRLLLPVHALSCRNVGRTLAARSRRPCARSW